MHLSCAALMVVDVTLDKASASARRGDETGAPARLTSIDEVYEKHFDFVWRNVRRMGVPPAAVDDAVQDVFLVVHRRIREFQGRSSLETWLFGILLRVARDHRRASERRANLRAARAREGVATGESPEGPLDLVARAQAVRLLYQVLDQIDEQKRAILVLVELEGVPVTDAAEAMGMNVNTAYARLRAARQQFEAAVARCRTREGGASR